MFFRLLIFFIIIFLGLLASALVYYDHALKTDLPLPESGLLIEIKKGASLNQILGELSSELVLEQPWPIKLYARQTNLGNTIKAGEFLLKPPMNGRQLLHFLSSNNQVSYAVQFIEGSTVNEVLRALGAQEKLQQTLVGVTQDELAQKLGLGSLANLEGQFYPDTYFYHKGDTDMAILKRANVRLQSILNEEWAGRESHLPLKSAYEALILASIIEKETGVPAERSEIAGVFVRRLQKNMRLQTDPTVIYGMGERYQGKLRRKHLLEETAYNTYRIQGLPPTPIALVGRAAIHAALHPKPGNSLYFVAKGDGSHQFSATLEEHNRAVRQYQLNRREDYRSTVH